jgi:dynein intermediate chain
MSDLNKEAIQKEIEAKKRKLEELKAKRMARAAPGSENVESKAAPLSTPAVPSHDDLLSSVDHLIKASPNASLALQDAHSTANQTNSSTSATSPTSSSPPSFSRVPPKLVSSRLPTIDIGPSERIKYDQNVQTLESAMISEAINNQTSGNDNDEEELRKERDQLRVRELELLSSIRSLQSQLDSINNKEDQKLHTELSNKEKEQIEHSQEFHDFFSRTSTLMERLLEFEGRGGRVKGQNYDFLINYEDEEEENEKTARQEKLRPLITFQDASKTFGRSVSAIDWNPKYPELLLASYAQLDDESFEAQESGQFDAQGCVLIWNRHLSSRPEYHFSCDSSVLNAWFHPIHAKLLIAATHTGQLIMWDTRQKSTPVNRTSLANSHTFPIYASHMLPMVNGLYNIISTSVDGHTCVWNEQNWHMPSHESYLKPQPVPASMQGQVSITSSKDELTAKCIDFPPRDHNTLLAGSDEGHIYKARIFESKDHVFDTIYNAHDAPITNLRFLPQSATAATTAPQSLQSQFFITSSYDWTVKLWSNTLSRPLHVFESARDYVFDCQFHPVNPALFAQGDGTGKIDLWNLNGAMDVPAVSIQAGEIATFNSTNLAETSTNSNSRVLSELEDFSSAPLGGENYQTGHAISKLKWNTNGSVLAAGSSNGLVHLFELASEMQELNKDEAGKFWDTMARKLISH